MKKFLNGLVCLSVSLSCGLFAGQGDNNASPQLFSSFEQEQSEPFSYLEKAIDQLGFMDSPEATAVTNGGTFSNTFNAIQFLYGENLRVANKRVVTLERDYLPIIHFSLTDGDLVYRAEAFSAPQDFNPSNNLVSYIRWVVTNTSEQSAAGKLGFALNKGALHNTYCTPW